MMDRNNSNGNGAARARGFMAVCAMLAMGLGMVARPAEAAPFAYVANGGDAINAGTVSVIDTATNMVVATVVGVGVLPEWVAVTPDGAHAYVANGKSNNVSVIDTASNTVVGSPIPVGSAPFRIAFTPDGNHAYVTISPNNVSVIDTASNTVVATVAVGPLPLGVAVTPDGKHAYVTSFGSNAGSNTVSVIDTASNMVVATFPVGSFPRGVAITPDGKHAYVASFGSKVGVPGTVSVIDTASNTVVGSPIPVGALPDGVAVTPDGKHAYVVNNLDNNVSVIDTAANTVVGTPIPVGTIPVGVGIGPPPKCIPFLAFNAKLEIDLEHKPKEDRFELVSSFTLGSASNGINPATESVTLRVGTFTTTIPAGSFKEIGLGIFVFHGAIGGVRLEALIAPTGAKRYALVAAAQDANLTGTVNPVPVTLTIGDDCGTASVTALIIP